MTSQTRTKGGKYGVWEYREVLGQTKPRASPELNPNLTLKKGEKKMRKIDKKGIAMVSAAIVVLATAGGGRVI